MSRISAGPASDDIPLDLARILTRNHVQGTFFVVGEKARLWRSRGRTDVIASLAPHDVALHTNLHSIHPTVSEYLAPCGWEDGVAEALRRDAPGFEFDPADFRPAGLGVGPGRRHLGAADPRRAKTGRRAVRRSTRPPTPPAAMFTGTPARSRSRAATWPTSTARCSTPAASPNSWQTMHEMLDRRIAPAQTWTGIFACHPTMLRAPSSGIS